MGLGGIPSAESLGIDIPRAGEVRQRLAALPDGCVFLPEEVFSSDPELLVAFFDLRDLDHVAIGGGFHVAIQETAYLRRLPSARKVANSWAERFQLKTAESGEWAAYRLRLAEWEPISGLNVLSSGPDSYLRLGRQLIRFTHAPDWMLEVSEEDSAMRALLTITPERFARTISEYLRKRSGSIELIERAVLHASNISRQYYSTEAGEKAFEKSAWPANPVWLQDAYQLWQRQEGARPS